MKYFFLLSIIFTVFSFHRANAHPPGMISKPACGENQTSNSLKEVCIGNIGAGGFHSDGAPETILSLFLMFTGPDGQPRQVALPVTYGGTPGKFVLKYVNPNVPVQNGAFQFAELSTFRVLGDASQITGIEGTLPGEEEFRVTFVSPLDASYFEKIQ